MQANFIKNIAKYDPCDWFLWSHDQVMNSNKIYNIIQGMHVALTGTVES